MSAITPGDVGTARPLGVFDPLGLMERNFREVLRVSAGEAYSRAEGMLKELMQPDTDFVCLLREGVLAGFLAMRHVIEESLPVVYLLELQIEHDIRRKGLGRALIAEARATGERTGGAWLEEALGTLLVSPQRPLADVFMSSYENLRRVLEPVLHGVLPVRHCLYAGCYMLCGRRCRVHGCEGKLMTQPQSVFTLNVARNQRRIRGCRSRCHD